MYKFKIRDVDSWHYRTTVDIIFNYYGTLTYKSVFILMSASYISYQLQFVPVLLSAASAVGSLINSIVFVDMNASDFLAFH